jgi:16S rRNA (guanine527-N7)-methyltransferase
MSHDEPFWRIPDWFEWFTVEQFELLKAYHRDLCKWNPKVNLVSVATLMEADRVHFADCISGIQLFTSRIPQGEKVFDLGSGNGFPGIVLSILRPDLKVVCVDSDQRKCGFLMQFTRRLKIENTTILCERIENLDKGSIRFAVNRGLGDVGRVLKLCDVLSVPRGTVLHFKGIEYEIEMENTPDALKTNWTTNSIGEYLLPGNGEQPSRVILISQRA